MSLVMEFVAFDRAGREVDWVDPVESYEEVGAGVWRVDNGYHEYLVRVPEGGRHEVRPRL